MYRNRVTDTSKIEPAVCQQGLWRSQVARLKVVSLSLISPGREPGEADGEKLKKGEAVPMSKTNTAQHSRNQIRRWHSVIELPAIILADSSDPTDSTDPTDFPEISNSL